MTLAELNALAERQRRQIEEQEKSMHTKQQRLSFLTQQSQQNGTNLSECVLSVEYQLTHSAKLFLGDSERLRKLREKVLDQEERLRLLRIGPEQNTALLSAELDSVRNLLEAKQRELSNSMHKVKGFY